MKNIVKPLLLTSIIIYSGNYQDNVLTMKGCQIPFTKISAIHQCHYADPHLGEVNVFQLTPYNLTALRSDISQLDTSNHCSCRFPPFLSLKYGSTVNHDNLLPALQIPACIYNASTLQDNLRNNFVRFNDLHNTSIIFPSTPYFSVESILQCETETNVPALQLTSCTHNNANNLTVEEYYNEPNSEHCKHSARNAFCQTIDPTKIEQIVLPTSF